MKKIISFQVIWKCENNFPKYFGFDLKTFDDIVASLFVEFREKFQKQILNV